MAWNKCWWVRRRRGERESLGPCHPESIRGDYKKYENVVMEKGLQSWDMGDESQRLRQLKDGGRYTRSSLFRITEKRWHALLDFFHDLYKQGRLVGSNDILMEHKTGNIPHMLQWGSGEEASLFLQGHDGSWEQGTLSRFSMCSRQHTVGNKMKPPYKCVSHSPRRNHLDSASWVFLLRGKIMVRHFSEFL